MIKAKKYNIEDTNVAAIGSDLDKKCREAAAATENAWVGAGKAVGLQIWRIEKFQVVAWPQEEYGNFFSNDSYIVLNTWKQKGKDALHWDIHFWLGETTSQDEAGTAAYKTVELDDLLGGGPVQHRECEGYESEAFLALFPKGVKYLEGGVESGFRHVKPEEYKARLLHVKGTRKNIRVTQVPCQMDVLNQGDIFIMDFGLKLITWVGSKAGIAEKTKATQIAQALDDERGSKVDKVVISESDTDADAVTFYEKLGGKPGDAIKSAEEGGADADVASLKKMVRLSDESGKVTFTVEQEGKLTKSKLDNKDVWIVDVGAEIFAWIGSACSAQERKLGLSYAQQYLNGEKDRPNYLPITRIMGSAENEQFLVHFDD